MSTILILNGTLVNENKIFGSDILIRDGLIERIDKNLGHRAADRIIDAAGRYVIPGMIDDQGHFREPGLTHKADIRSESGAAVAGGITSFMEMPNTIPHTLTQKRLQDKYDIAARSSVANYSFYMGASNDNLEEVLKTDPSTVCGIKVFMGSSTGNMLVDNETTLEAIFAKAPILIATHCESEAIISANMAKARKTYGEEVPVVMHPAIRSEEACFASSSFAVDLARRKGTRLHVLHLSTAKEMTLFDQGVPLKDKKITAEACIHHLWFDDTDYAEKGALIKWNPAVKKASDRAALLQGVLSGKIDVIATDHAPHTLEEKQRTYFQAPSGGPLVQHALVALLDLYYQGKINLEKIVEKTSHAVATVFDIDRRGYLREGYYADVVLIDLNRPWKAGPQNILAKCGWSPFEGHTFRSTVTHTIVSGNLVWEEGKLKSGFNGRRLQFNR